MKRVVFITGGSSGLGLEISRHLARTNFRVYAGFRNKKPLAVVGISFIKIDVTRDSDCHGAVKKIVDAEGRIDVLINNAGQGVSGPFEKFTARDFLNLVDVNAVGAFRLAKEVLPQMKSQNSGLIINITSLNGLVSFPGFAIYSASKFAAEAFGKALYYELQKFGIKVINLAPGAIYDPEASYVGHKPAREKFAFLKFLLPMITREQVAEAVLKLINKESPPSQVSLGRDAKLIGFINRIIPNALWNKIMLFIWNK
ncbi:MAG: 3-oxoacyl-ACP reductase [Candidatus Woesebacteria bacterium GW2011_GWB1_38_5b]|uniref:3-oxoacyl-ACP reductase n=1 Tax=Candidatus Woesebacteria bacterium GW2011_GWB1_38_5b TaxID=1618569 RepID=A0A0G0NB23_9BACT|nr:MAG: 3-oxoacyl-ACP reductase [Candidatus Woesebacteria bacterium GW2011_GWB1_38_5b]